MTVLSLPRLSRLAVAVLVLGSGLLGCSTEGIKTQGPDVATPSASAAPTAASSDAGDDSVSLEPTGEPDPDAPAIGLDESVPDGGSMMQPYLAADLGSGWKQTIVDKDGFDQWQGPECLLTTYNGLGSDGDDASMSAAMLDEVEKGMLQQQSSAERTAADPVEIADEAGAPVEFASMTIAYVNQKTGEPWTTTYAARQLSEQRVQMLVQVACPTSELDSGAVDEAMSAVFIKRSL